MHYCLCQELGYIIYVNDHVQSSVYKRTVAPREVRSKSYSVALEFGPRQSDTETSACCLTKLQHCNGNIYLNIP